MRSISPGLILTCTIPLLFGSPLSVHAGDSDYDALSRILKSSDTVATVTENSFVMDTDRIQWVTPELGIFTARFSSSPFDRINTERLIAGIATGEADLLPGQSGIMGVSVSWDRLQDRGDSTLNPENPDYVHRFITEAFYGIHMSDTIRIQPSLGVLTNSLNSDYELIAHLGLSVRF